MKKLKLTELTIKQRLSSTDLKNLRGGGAPGVMCCCEGRWSFGGDRRKSNPK